ncbi:MAG: hypothetical protein NVS3B20_20230 [Polyangiales bacterium]
MAKTDDLRKQREQQFADRALKSSLSSQSQDGVGKGSSPNAKESVEAEPVQAELDTSVSLQPQRRMGMRGDHAASREGSAEGTGACAVCGKVRTLNRGLVADHQKGLGKHCAGSRKQPA